MAKDSPPTDKKLLWRYPGWSQKDLEVILSPGHYLDIMPRRIFEPQESKRVRRARILGTHEGDLVLTLPQPPLPSPLLGQPLEITFLHENKGELRRYGYYTLILDTLDEFPPIPPGHPGMVVLFPREKDIAPTNLRSSRRFKAPRNGEICLTAPGMEGIVIEDLSFKGIRFSHDNPRTSPSVDSQIHMNLVLHDKTKNLSGRVAGCGEREGRGVVSVELTPMGLGLWSDLLVVLHGVDINA